MSAWNELNPEEWICECGAKLDPLSSEWRCAGSYWEHYHGYPIGHVAVFRKDLMNEEAKAWADKQKQYWIDTAGREMRQP